jgi:hypothetical protein
VILAVRRLTRTVMFNSRLILRTLFIIAAWMVAVWLVVSVSRHPEFGRIYGTEMVEENLGDSWQTGWERKEAALRRVFHLRQRPKPPQRGMQIGPSRLGWSLGGHIYMSNPDSNEPLWEFTLSNRKQLREVTREDLRCEFYGMRPEVLRIWVEGPY